MMLRIPARPGNSAIRRAYRSGFTMLEMVLTLVIAMMLLLAVYVVLEIQFTLAQSGREVLEEGTLARSILTRVTGDIAASLGAVNPKVLPVTGTTEADNSATEGTDSSQSANSSTSSNSSSTTGSTSSSSSSNSGTDTGTDTASTTTPTTTTTNSSSVFNLQVSGNAQVLMLSSALPLNSQTANRQQSTSTSNPDLRRVLYWVVQDKGLAKYHNTAITAADVNNPPLVGADAERSIIAPEVKSITFEYFDGSSWTSSWDGTSLSEDGETPIGPPSAIAVHLTIETVEIRAGQAPVTRTANYRHIVAIPTGNNYSVQQQ